jgi:hypothetical protein
MAQRWIGRWLWKIADIRVLAREVANEMEVLPGGCRDAK